MSVQLISPSDNSDVSPCVITVTSTRNNTVCVRFITLRAAFELPCSTSYRQVLPKLQAYVIVFLIETLDVEDSSPCYSRHASSIINVVFLFETLLRVPTETEHYAKSSGYLSRVDPTRDACLLNMIGGEASRRANVLRYTLINTPECD